MRSFTPWTVPLFIFLALPTAAWGQAKVSQSSTVAFPGHHRVRVETVEEIGKFPKITFYDLKARSLLFETSIKDDSGFLIPNSRGAESDEPILRFAVLRKSGFPGPIVMAVGVSPGGSDNGFWLELFGEVNGRLVPLLDKPPSAAIQGGFYVGNLNHRYGFGLVTWDFIWGNDTEGHGGRHKYELSVYKLKHGKFVKVQTYKTRRKYNYDYSQYPPRELGIRATDQRLLVPGLKKFLT